jgi:hypothetical protein
MPVVADAVVCRTWIYLRMINGERHADSQRPDSSGDLHPDVIRVGRDRALTR